MALIKCPECGNQISSSSNQCIHCGCKFTACPECGNVAVGKLSVCPQCGFSFKKSDNITEHENSELDGDLFKLWQKASPADGIVIKILKIVKIVAYILPLAFLLGLIYSFIKWQNVDELEKIVTLGKTKDTMRTMLIFACIFGTADVLSETAIKSYIKLRCSSWIRQSKIDGVTYLKIHGNDIVDTTEIENYQLFAEAVYYADKFKHKNIIYVKLIIYLLCAAALFACVGFCAMQNLNEAMSAEINGSEFSFQYSALIALGIVAAIYTILGIILESVGSKNYNAWFKKITEEAIED